MNLTLVSWAPGTRIAVSPAHVIGFTQGTHEGQHTGMLLAFQDKPIFVKESYEQAVREWEDALAGRNVQEERTSYRACCPECWHETGDRCINRDCACHH
jgi:hypothetical protein